MLIVNSEICNDYEVRISHFYYHWFAKLCR